jgi:ribonuclease G
MPRNQIVINVDVGETRVALIENGIVTELNIERRGDKSVVGDVYLGKVTRVLPGMNAAFVDIGLERAAFLHLEDVVSEGALRGSAADDDDDDAGRSHGHAHGHGHPQLHRAAGATQDVPQAPGTAELVAAASGGGDAAVADDSAIDERVSAPADVHPEVAGDAIETGTAESAAADGDAESDDDADDEGDELPEAEASADGEVLDEAPVDDDEGDATMADLIADTDAEGGSREAGSAVVSPTGAGARGDRRPRRGRDRDRDRRGGRNNNRSRRKEVRGGNAPRERSERSERGAERAKAPPAPKNIRDVLREGQEIVVQVSKGPISTKGARCTSHISLPGRYVVYMPTGDQIGVSKRIGNDKERKRLREVIETIKPEKGGLIVRTASEGLTKKQLKNDVGYLVHLWADIWKKRESARSPAMLYSELDVVLRTVRDVMGPDIEKIVIDDKEAHARCVRFVEQFMPDRKDDVELYTGSEPIFDEYGIEDEIARALARKVPLKSGGYLIIDEAEALTAIDVNSGRFVGKRDVEETVTQTNLEAVSEIAYQLRLRNLGGLIILDLIDMDRQANRDKVYRALNEALKQDKAKTSILRISELGLIEMTRKRTRESLGRQLYEPCFYCDGTGNTQSKLTIAYEVLRQIRREKDQLPGYNIIVNCHPAVADTLKHEIREVLEEVQKRTMRRIVVASKPEYHIEQFDLQGKSRGAARASRPARADRRRADPRRKPSGAR